MTDAQDRARGEAAKRLLAEPLYGEAFAAVRARLQMLMMDAASDEVTLKAKQALGLLADLQRWMARVVQDGEVAAQSIEIAEAQARAQEKRNRR
jgi:hypothetical protein